MKQLFFSSTSPRHKTKTGLGLSETFLTLSSAYISFLFPSSHPDPPLREISLIVKREKRAQSDSLPTSSRLISINSEDVPNPLLAWRSYKSQEERQKPTVISEKRSYRLHPKDISEFFQKDYGII